MAFGRAGFAWIEAALSRCGHKPPPVAGGLANARRRDVGSRLRLGHWLDPPESQEGGYAYADGLRTTTRTR